MQLGDLIKWKGFDSVRNHLTIKMPDSIGLIIEEYLIDGEKRFDVAWQDGTFGRLLYEQTIELINENSKKT